MKPRKSWQSQWGTSRRLYVSFTLLVAMLLSLLSIAYWSFCRLAQANRWNVHSYQVLIEIRGLTSSFFYLRRDARNLAVSKDPKYLDAIKDGQAAFANDFRDTSALITDENPDEQAQLRKINDSYRHWSRSYVVPLLLNQKPDDEGAKRDAETLRTALKDMRQTESALLKWRAARVGELQGRTQVTLLFGSGFAVLMAVVLSTLLARSAAEIARSHQELEHEVAERTLAQTQLGDAHDDLQGVHEALQSAHEGLDERVRERTAQLEESKAQLRLLAARVEAVREEEKARMAREIHDQLGGALTGLKMDALWLLNRMPLAANRSETITSSSKIEAMMRSIDDTIELVGKIASELRPAILDDLGLVAAIEWQTEEFQTRSGIACVFEPERALRPVAPETATGIFRIFQEALTNIARHAGATRVCIQLSELEGWLVLRVADDGRGFHCGHSMQSKSLGLLGMRERARLLGGEVALQSDNGQGTLVTLRVPLEGTGKELHEGEMKHQ